MDKGRPNKHVKRNSPVGIARVMHWDRNTQTQGTRAPDERVDDHTRCSFNTTGAQSIYPLVSRRTLGLDYSTAKAGCTTQN